MSCMDGSRNPTTVASPPSHSSPPSSSSCQVGATANNNVVGNNKKKGRSSCNREGFNSYWLPSPISPSPSQQQQQQQMAYPHHQHHPPHHHGYMAMAPPLPPNMSPPHCFGQHSLGFESSSTYVYYSTLPPASSYDLSNKIVQQIDYYFSDDNLAKDVYLRSKMDDKGWVPVTLIASFSQVAEKTNDVQVVLESLRDSSIVEVQSGKLRRRDNWKKWLLPSSSQEH